MAKRKFYKTTIKVVVLSEGPLENIESLHDVAYSIDEGDCSGVWSVKKSEVITGKQAANALLKQGSDPEFFQIDKNGKNLD